MRFSPAHHTPKEQMSHIRPLAPIRSQQNHYRWVKRYEVWVSEVIPPVFPTIAKESWDVVGGRSLKAGDRETKNQTSKMGQQTEAGPQRSWELKEQQLRHALKWRGSDSSSPWLGGKQGRQALVVS